MNGIINVLKPPGMTSSGVVTFLKRVLQVKKIGHAGTLDPGAAGVLVILIGRATRLSDFFMAHEKEYIAELHTGYETDTLDSYGEILACQETEPLQEEALARACRALVGEIWQTPPAYSAVRIDGKKSYALARAGIEAERKQRQVTISDICIKSVAAQKALLQIVCSKGTYVRTLLHDIGKEMGMLAYTSFLLRSRSGNFHVQAAFTLDEIKQMAEQKDFSFLLAPEETLGELPMVRIGKEYIFALENGQKIEVEVNEPRFRLYAGDIFFGIGEKQGAYIKLKTVLR